MSMNSYDRAKRHPDIVVARPPGHRPLEFDLLVPGERGPYPVVFWIHGGGWCAGSRRDPTPGMPGADLHARLLERGFAVGLVEYRLSHEAVYPAQLDDIGAAIEWTRTHADELHLDVTRFAVMGDSAGGHLAALAGLARDPALGLHAVVDWYGPSDLTFPGGSPEPGDPAIPLFGGLPADLPHLARLGSPLHQVHPGAPPFLCVHGADDQNVPLSHSETLVAALRAAGVRAELDVVADGGHGFTGADISPIIERSIDFLADVLRAGTSKT